MEPFVFRKRCPNPTCIIEDLPDVANVCCTCATPAKMLFPEELQMHQMMTQHLSTLHLESEQSRRVFIPDAEDTCSKEERDRYEQWRDDELIRELELKCISAVTPQQFRPEGSKHKHFRSLFDRCDVTVFPLCIAVCGAFHKNLMKEICADPSTYKKVIFVNPPPNITPFNGWEFTESLMKYDCDPKKKLNKTIGVIEQACRERTIQGQGFGQGHANDVIRRSMTEQQLGRAFRDSMLTHSTISSCDSRPEAEKGLSSHHSRISFLSTSESARGSTANPLERQRIKSMSQFGQVLEHPIQHNTQAGHIPARRLSTSSTRSDRTDVTCKSSPEDDFTAPTPSHHTDISESNQFESQSKAPSHHTGSIFLDPVEPSMADTGKSHHTGSIASQESNVNKTSEVKSHHTGSITSHQNAKRIQKQESILPIQRVHQEMSSDTTAVKKLVLLRENINIESDLGEKETPSPYDERLPSFPLDPPSNVDKFEKSESPLRPGVTVHYSRDDCYEQPPSIYVLGQQNHVGLTDLVHALYKGDPEVIQPFLEDSENQSNITRYVIPCLTKKRSWSTREQMQGIVALANMARFTNNADSIAHILKCLDVSLSQLSYTAHASHSETGNDLKRVLEVLKVSRLQPTDDIRYSYLRCNRRVLQLLFAHHSELFETEAVTRLNEYHAENCVNLCSGSMNAMNRLQCEGRILAHMCKAIRKRHDRKSKTVLLSKLISPLILCSTTGKLPESEPIDKIVGNVLKEIKKQNKGFMLVVLLEMLCTSVYGCHSLPKEGDRRLVEDQINKVIEAFHISLPKYHLSPSDAILLDCHLAKYGHILKGPKPQGSNTDIDILQDFPPKCLSLCGTFSENQRSETIYKGQYGFKRAKSVLVIACKQSEFRKEIDILKQLKATIGTNHIPKLVAYQTDTKSARMPFYLLSFEGEPIALPEKLFTMLRAEEPENRHLKRRLHYCKSMIEAIQFCHSQRILVRKITAASFCRVKTSGSPLVKLFDFENAVKVPDGNEDFSFTGSAADNLPTLWMAAKSLLEYYYDANTDIHSLVLAILEVLSFAIHPYSENSDVPLNVFIPQILRNDILPQRRPSLPQRIYKSLMDMIVEDGYSFDALFKAISTSDVDENEWTDGQAPLEIMRDVARKQPCSPEKGIPVELHDVQTKEDLKKHPEGTRLYKTEMEYQAKIASTPKKSRYSIVDELKSHECCKRSKQNIDEMTGCISKTSSTDKETTYLRKLLGKESDDIKNIARITGIPRDANICKVHPSCTMYLGNGSVSILEFLSKNREMVDFRYGWYAQAASGMTYLHQSGILHCNLKADALYITDDRIVKIGNLNRATQLTRSVHNRNLVHEIAFPFQVVPRDIKRWVPIETLLTGAMSCYSDVAMFGCTLWEVERYIELESGFYSCPPGMHVPYGDYNLDQVYGRKRRQENLPRPEYCSDGLYNLILAMTTNPPHHRPLFPEIVEKITALGKCSKDPLPKSTEAQCKAILPAEKGKLNSPYVTHNKVSSPKIQNPTNACNEGADVYEEACAIYKTRETKPKISGPTNVKQEKEEPNLYDNNLLIRGSTNLKQEVNSTSTRSPGLFRRTMMWIEKRMTGRADTGRGKVHSHTSTPEYNTPGPSTTNEPDYDNFNVADYLEMDSIAVSRIKEIKQPKEDKPRKPSLGVGDYLTPICPTSPRKIRSSGDIASNVKEPKSPVRSNSDSSLLSPKGSIKRRALEELQPAKAEEQETYGALPASNQINASNPYVAMDTDSDEDYEEPDVKHMDLSGESENDYATGDIKVEATGGSNKEQETPSVEQVDQTSTGESKNDQNPSDAKAKTCEESTNAKTKSYGKTEKVDIQPIPSKGINATPGKLPSRVQSELKRLHASMNAKNLAPSTAKWKATTNEDRKISESEDVYNWPQAPVPNETPPKPKKPIKAVKPKSTVKIHSHAIEIIQEIPRRSRFNNNEETKTCDDIATRKKMSLPRTEIKESVDMSQKSYKLGSKDTYEYADTSMQVQAAFGFAQTTFTDYMEPAKLDVPSNYESMQAYSKEDPYSDPGFAPSEFEDDD